MKRFQNPFNVLRKVMLPVLLAVSMPLLATVEADTLSMDSVEISLLTCEPHDEVYSLYGHTALRYHDLRRGGLDLAFNYGVFNFQAPYFTLRFIFGLTDYELGAFPYVLFKREYERFGSMVTEQVLQLTREEKMLLTAALSENLLPENTVYRYNFLENNCTTKARDIIERCINGHLEYTGRQEHTITYRQIIHEMTARHPWSRFGNDLLLGLQADQPTSQRQQEFLPKNLMYDFDHAVIHADGRSYPLVRERRTAVAPGLQEQQPDFPLSPRQCANLLAALGIVLFVLQHRQRRAFLPWDLTLMVLSGTIGLVLTAMVFSQHPTVRLNLQILLCNPLPWCFLWPVLRRHATRYWQLTAVLCLLFLVGSCFQHYAEGMWSLALCLLLQCYIHLIRVSS